MVRLSDSKRDEFSKPIGVLIPDADITIKEIKKYAGSNANYITIGDATTERASKLGLRVCLEIVDGFEKRLSRDLPKPSNDCIIIKCKNPPGHITDEAFDTVYNAMGEIPDKHIRISVDGEEDLLALPVCAYAADGFAVLYGQPNEGIVVVRIEEGSRNKAKSMLQSMIDGYDDPVAV
ncbi:MAG: hypothetical protein K8823_649 [Cenarchaeum symbiont of Oopsacas minuta]|nr:hypothetical protein [Cenarchaeum symbiont of Oopsacas minuta]